MTNRFPDLSPEAYKRVVAEHGGDTADVFASLVKPIVVRYLAQTKQAPWSDDLLAAFARELWAETRVRPLPRPLPPRDKGLARELTDDEMAAPVERVRERSGLAASSLPAPQQISLVKQFLRAIFQPEFLMCRLSYQERDRDNRSIRQQPDVAAQRIGGSHCEDCPLFLTLAPDKHVKVMRIGWVDDTMAALDANPLLFVPADFRDLRRFLRLHARFGGVRTA